MTRTSRGRRAQWPIRGLPRWRQVLVAGYCVAICAAVAVTRVQASQLRLFAILLACSAAAVELTRRMGEPAGVVRDVHAIWDLPTAVLLPPLYVLLAPVPRMILTQVRVRQMTLYQRAYTAAAVGLAYAQRRLPSMPWCPFSALVPGWAPGDAPWPGRCWWPAAA
jgi:hypothetical protein